MKKGFTLIEIIIVFAILAVFITISTINFERLNQSSKVESIANDIAAMLKDAYENSNKQLEYDSWRVELIKYGKIFQISLKESNNNIRDIEVNSIVIKLNDGIQEVLLKDDTIIQFNPNGLIKLKSKDKGDFNYDVYEYEKLFIVLSHKNNPLIEKKIEINSVPPGNITIK